jgi:hypothetical protein
MTSFLRGDFAMSNAKENTFRSVELDPLHDALLKVLPEIPQLITDTPLRLWRGAYMEPGLIRIARAYTINKVRYVINLHISRIDQDAMIEPHFHPFGNMAVFLVKGAYTNILGRKINEQNQIVDPVHVRIEEGDSYVMSSKLCHDVEAQTNPTFSIMLHKKSNIDVRKPEDFEKIFPLSDEQKERELKKITQAYFNTDIFKSYLKRTEVTENVI